jgi:hypothetical protein
MFMSKLEGRRRVGRPRLRRLEDVEKDLLEITAKRWRQKRVEREKLRRARLPESDRAKE